MPRNDEAAQAANEWMRRARSNLARARQPKPTDAVWEDLCFDAQQAVEKALKAVLDRFKIDFPKTHSLETLFHLLEISGHPAPPSLLEAKDLTDYAVEMRHPFPEEGEEVTEEDHRRALAIAEKVVRWAEGMIQGP